MFGLNCESWLGKISSTVSYMVSLCSGDFDTVVVKDGTEIDKTAVHASAPTAKDSSPAPGHLRSLSIRRVGDKQVESRYSCVELSHRKQSICPITCKTRHDLEGSL